MRTVLNYLDANKEGGTYNVENNNGQRDWAGIR